MISPEGTTDGAGGWRDSRALVVVLRARQRWHLVEGLGRIMVVMEIGAKSFLHTRDLGT